MTTLILQIDIGHGTQWGDESAPDIFRSICIPSVKNYAQRHGYDYELITESSYLSKIGPLNFLLTESKHYSFERYLRLKTHHENVVYIDNDIYISDVAGPLPEICGLMAVAEPGKTNSQKLFSEVHNLPHDTTYYNSGLFMADRHTADAICDYMIYRATNNQKAKGKSTDNMMFNEFVHYEQSQFIELSEKWNYMPMLIGSSKGLRSNCLHLVGKHGKLFLSKLVSTGHPIKPLLENITIGNIVIE